MAERLHIEGFEHLSDKQMLYALLWEKKRRIQSNKILKYFPEKGPLRRELYPRHMEFFAAGAKYRERCMIAANRIGKTESCGGYETTLHLTGMYPDWWTGRRWDRPIRAWVAGKSGQTVRDILQEKLLGPPGEWGTGLIPKSAILDVRKRPGNVPDAVESVTVKHISGGKSRLGFKSFDQRRQSFEGVEQDLIWLDEESPDDVYSECIVRTMTTDGMVLLTFTPLQGLSEVVLRFMPEGRMPDEDTGRFVCTATWDDAPHLGEREREEILSATPPHLRDARSKGVPHLGAGVIYPVTEDMIVIDPIQIQPYWRRVYGMDVGWNKTAAVWGALDRDSDILYLYSEHYRGEAEPPIHAEAIKSRGSWIPGVIDPSARGRSQSDGQELYSEYLDMGLDISPANNAVEAGIYEVWTRMSTGRLKVFNTLTNWLMEMRLYRRNEVGKIVKDRDHLMDCTRYLCISGLDVAKSEYENNNMGNDEWEDTRSGKVASNPIGGYF